MRSLIFLTLLISTALAQIPPNWVVDFYNGTACTGPIPGGAAGSPGTQVHCIPNAGELPTSILAEGIEYNNFEVLLYADEGCQSDPFGSIMQDDLCFVVPESPKLQAIGVHAIS